MLFNCNDILFWACKLPVNYFRLSTAYQYIRTRLFDITPDMTQYFIRVLATIADAAHANFSDLPAVLFIDLGNRHFKLIPHPCHNRFDNLPFIFQRMAHGQVQCDLTDANYHVDSIEQDG